MTYGPPQFGPRYSLHPRPGYFRVRAYRKGPWVPCEIRRAIPMDPATGEILERSAPLEAFRGGWEAEVMDVWGYGKEITRDDFKWLTALHALRIKNRPTSF